MSNPTRTCIGCGFKATKNELVRLVFSKEDRIVFQNNSNIPGRGAYLHKTENCLNGAIKRKVFARCFRKHVRTLSIELFTKEYIEWITDQKY